MKTAESIMQTSSPVEQKQLGRRVEGFSLDEWYKVCRDVVKTGSMAKVGLPNSSRSIFIDELNFNVNNSTVLVYFI